MEYRRLQDVPFALQTEAQVQFAQVLLVETA
jgi:hypothetical protein